MEYLSVMKTLFRYILAPCLFASPLFGAKVSFSLDIESIAASGGSALSDSGLLVLIVDSADNGFQSPVAGTIVTGDDQIVATWDLSTQGPGTSDITLLSGGVEYGPDWDAGDPLALLWFPGLSAANQVPSPTESFGFFSDAGSYSSGDPWFMPVMGSFHSLKLFTAAASKLVASGDLPLALGEAGFALGQAIAGVSAPDSVTLTPSGSTIVVDWAGGAAASGGFLVQRKIGPTGMWETVGLVDSGESSFTDSSNILPGVDYDYRLVSLSGFESAASGVEMVQSLRSKFINLAGRGFMGDDVVTRRGIGFLVEGSEPMDVLVQAVGPSMPGSLAKPDDTLLTFFYGIAPEGLPRQIAQNDDWDIDTTEAMAILEAQDKYSAQLLGVGAGDSALIATVEEREGGYTNRVQNPLTGGGVASVQVYDLNYLEMNPADARMTALATRGFVGVNAETLRGSFNLYGEVPMDVLIRVSGPALAALSQNDPFTDDNTLADPFVRVLRWNGSGWDDYAENDNWSSRSDSFSVAQIDAMSERVGLTPFSTGSNDCIVVGTFEPGTYTALVNGVGDTTGVALIEIYEVPPDTAQ